MDKQEMLQQWVDESRSIVFFGGAGVSTESGIPDFRSTDGLYRQSYDYPPETILSRSFFDRYPAEFFRFYRAKMLAPDAKPNAHYIARSHSGLGVERNIVTLCNDCHNRYDQSADRRYIREEIKAYLMSQYPDWDETTLIYRRG